MVNIGDNVKAVVMSCGSFLNDWPWHCNQDMPFHWRGRRLTAQFYESKRTRFLYDFGLRFEESEEKYMRNDFQPNLPSGVNSP